MKDIQSYFMEVVRLLETLKEPGNYDKIIRKNATTTRSVKIT